MENRRQFERIFFSVEDGIRGSFALAGSQMYSDAAVMDLSVGGIRLTAGRDVFPHLKEGERLMLIQLDGASGLESVACVDMEIRWILRHPLLNHIGLGCHFLNLSSEVRRQIRAFMDSWISDS